MEVQKRADKLRKKSLASAHDIYFHAINDFMSKKRKKMDPDRAKFTFGEGTTGHRREVYYAGWAFIASELDKGVSLEELASIQKRDVPDYVNRNIKDV